LKIVGRLNKDSIDITAYVDGTQVATAHDDSIFATPWIEFTGVAGWVPPGSSGPGEWTLTSFSRQVPHNG
jgi:hypothetical protein